MPGQNSADFDKTSEQGSLPVRQYFLPLCMLDEKFSRQYFEILGFKFLLQIVS